MPGNHLIDKGKDNAKKAKRIRRKAIIAKIIASMMPALVVILIIVTIASIVGSLIAGFVKIINAKAFNIGAESTAQLEQQEIPVVNTKEKYLNLSDKVIDQLIMNLRENGLDVARLKMLGEKGSSEIDEMSDKKINEAMRKYIREYYATELITQYPDMSETPGERKGFLGFVDSGIDAVNEKMGKYQGCITLIHPDENGNVTLDKDGRATNEYLTYITEEEFQRKCENSELDVLNHFTISGDNIKVAGYTETTDSSGTTTSYYATSLNFKAIASAYTMPMEFLLMLNLYSQNPEFTYAFAKMVDDSQIVLAVQKNYSETTQQVITKLQELEPVYEQQPVMENGQPKLDANGNPIMQKVDTGRTQWGEEQETSETVTTKSYSPSIQLVLADTWIVKKQVGYKNEDTSIEPSDVVEPIEGETVRGSVQTITNNISNVYREDIGKTTEEEKTKTVLGLLRNAEGTYKEENLLEFDPDNRYKMKYVKYPIPNTTAQRSPSENIVTGAKMMIDDLEKNESTQNQAEIMKYLMYVYTGVDRYGGATEFDQLKDLFVTRTFLENSFVSSMSTSFIHNFEGTGTSPVTPDGKYVVYKNSGDYPTVGHGIRVDIHKELLIQAGAKEEDLVAGGQIPVEIVDAVEQQIMNQTRSSVESKLSSAGITLKPYQIDALVSRVYNCGMGGIVNSYGKESFITAYKKYWKETDNELGVQPNDTMYQHKLYTNCMDVPVKNKDGQTLAGLVKRRKAEWILFKTGIYSDGQGNSFGQWTESSEAAEKILQKAEEIHAYMENNDYTYALSNLNSSFQASITGNHVACCATYVSWVLQEAGYNMQCIHSSPGLHSYLESKCQKITSYADLQPGDIAFLNTNGNSFSHVQIYAGNGTWYNAGTTEAIQRANPYDQGTWAATHFTEALRLNKIN